MKRPPKPAPGTPTVCRGIPRGTKIVTRDVVGSALACSTDDRGRPVVLVGAEVPRAQVDRYMRDVRRRLAAPAVEDPRPRPVRPTRGAGTPEHPGTRTALPTIAEAIDAESAAWGHAITRPIDRAAFARGARVTVDGVAWTVTPEALYRLALVARLAGLGRWRGDGATVEKQTADSYRRAHLTARDVAVDAWPSLPFRVHLVGWGKGKRAANGTLAAERGPRGTIRLRVDTDADWRPRLVIVPTGTRYDVRHVRWTPAQERGDEPGPTITTRGTYPTREEADEARDEELRASREAAQRAGERERERDTERRRPAPAAPPESAPRHFPIVSELTDDPKAPRDSYASEAATVAREKILSRITPQQLRARLHTWGSTRLAGEVWYLEPGERGKGRWVRIDNAPGWSPLVEAHRAAGAAYRRATERLDETRERERAWSRELDAIEARARDEAREACAREKIGPRKWEARRADALAEEEALCARKRDPDTQARCRDDAPVRAASRLVHSVEGCISTAIDAGRAARHNAQRRAKETPRR